MKFSVSKEKLLEGLQTVQNVVSTRTTLPILSNVLLQADEGKLRFTTTDLDVGISGTVEASIEKPGSTTLPARRLAGIVNLRSHGSLLPTGNRWRCRLKVAIFTPSTSSKPASHSFQTGICTALTS